MVRPQSGPPPGVSPTAHGSDPTQVQGQEDYIRSLLRSQEGPTGQGKEEAEDPIMKLMQSFIGTMGGAEGSTPNASGGGGGLPFSPEDISQATGLPSYLTNMLMRPKAAPPTPAQEKTASIWKLVHVLFSIVAGIYLVYTLDLSAKAFGANPPSPPTVRHPLLVFLTGELLVQGSKSVMADDLGTSSTSAWLGILQDTVRDGCIVVFIMGATAWWQGDGKG